MGIDNMEPMRSQQGSGQQQEYRFRHYAAGDKPGNHGNDRSHEGDYGQRDKFIMHSNLLWKSYMWCATIFILIIR